MPPPPGRYVQVAPNSTGSKIQNLAVTQYIDQQDGNGPQLVTTFMQVTAYWPVDVNGNPLEFDEAFPGADWKRQLLDETRAIRLGIQCLVENRRDMIDSDESLLEQAQKLREEPEDVFTGQQVGTGG